VRHRETGLFFDDILPDTWLLHLLLLRVRAGYIEDLFEETFEVFILPGSLVFAGDQGMGADNGILR